MQADATLPPPFRRNYKNVFQAFYDRLIASFLSAFVCRWLEQYVCLYIFTLENKSTLYPPIGILICLCTLFFKWANSGLFCLFSSFSDYDFKNTNCKKRRWCAWDLNLRAQDGRRWLNHWAMYIVHIRIDMDETSEKVWPIGQQRLE